MSQVKELFRELFVELTGQYVSTFVSYPAILLAVILAVGLWRAHHRRQGERVALRPLIPPFDAHAYSSYVAAGTVVLLVFILLSGTGVALALAGYIPYKTFEGELAAINRDDLVNTAVVVFPDDSDVAVDVTTVDGSGYFSFSGLFRRKYRFRALKLVGDKMLVSEFTRDLRSSDSSLRSYDYPTETLRAAQLSPIYFDTGKADLDGGATSSISGYSGSLQGAPDIVFFSGNADETGSAARNYELGLERAGNVEHETEQSATFGSSSSWIVSFGEQRPAVKGDYATALAQNRRVEVYALYRQ